MLGVFTGVAQTGSTLRDELQVPTLILYYSNFQYQQNIKGYDPGYVELDNGAKHYSDSGYYDKYVYRKPDDSLGISLRTSQIEGAGLNYDHFSEFKINGRGAVSGSHPESVFTDKSNYDAKNKVLRIDSVTEHPVTSDIMEVKYSIATSKDGKGITIPQNQLNFKEIYVPKTVVSDELMSNGKLNIWANEAAKNIYRVNGTRSLGVSSNGVVFEFWSPETFGDSFKFYPTFNVSPQK